MKLKRQVTGVDISIKLHELRFTKPSLFYREWTGAKENEIESWKDNKAWYGVDNVNCYTVAELIDYIYSVTKESFWMYHNAGEYLLQYGMNEGNYSDPNLANCYAQYIIEKLLDQPL